MTLERIKNIVIDIKADKEWVNDSHTQAEYKGVCDGLDRLVNHLEEVKEESVMTVEQIKQWLVNEIQHNAPVVDGTEEMSDGSYDIHVGRMECAESLLKQIEESVDDN